MFSFLPLAILLAGASLNEALHIPYAHRHSRSRRDANTDLVAASWYAGWHSDDVPLANVSWNKYTHMIYSFALTSADGSMVTLADSDKELLPQFVQTAHANNVKALLSVGGWTGGQYFSTNVADASNRTSFVSALTDLAKQYSLDGIDFDWEYPNNVGIGCNTNSTADVDNLLQLLQELRADPAGSQFFLTATTPILPWNDASGSPATNLSGFADTLDYLAIMNYDVYGSFSATAGPNSPLNDTCTSSANQQGSAATAITAWNAAGIPMNKLVLGVPAYGHSFRVAQADALPSEYNGALALYPKFDQNVANQPLGDSWDTTDRPDGGWLAENGTFGGADGIKYAWDECSQTPFLYNSTSEVYVAYDDATSYQMKGNFVKSNGLRGFAMWETGGDYKDILVNSIRSAAGFSS
ncbi:hypothetical protein EVG20_g4659 [Dentipellis fragilis]|uniref:GH18 domain-containing protein n=1 Tax=Dentipellis fragilis TaxID=205917 RepID=A0A4Y9YXT3_9AGAM|nr:hypothetical protein EVG20_g4659 [Dentipellis fragilis]